MKKLFASTIVALTLVAAPPVTAQREAIDLSPLYSLKEGDIPPQEFVEAVKSYRKAADQGKGVAMSHIGSMYNLGQGVLQDHVIAHMWFNLASAQGDKFGADNRDRIAKKMTPADLSIAQRLARECLARNYKNCGQ